MTHRDLLVGVDSSDDVIQHFGTKGMKWGFRKRRESKRRDKARAMSSRQTSKEWKKRYQNRRSLTNKDLKRYTERLRLENDLAEQVKRQSTLTQKPQKQSMFKDISRQVLSNVLTDAGRTGLKKGYKALSNIK